MTKIVSSVAYLKKFKVFYLLSILNQIIYKLCFIYWISLEPWLLRFQAH